MLQEKVPSPADVGLPEKFSKWRSGQEQALHSAVNTSKRVSAFCCPTGWGKSPFVIATALLSGQSTCIVTATKGLQDQYMKDFSSIGLVDLRGRRNYVCALKDDAKFTCEDGYNARCPYKGTVGCPSSQAEMRAAVSRLVVTNYDKWTASRKYGLGMSHFTQVIFDEGHDMPDALARAMQVTLHHKEIEETLQVPFLDGSDADDMREWKNWAVLVRQIAIQKALEAYNKIKGVSDPKQSWVRHYGHMRNLAKRLGTVATARPIDWIVEQRPEGYQFDPIRPGRYVEAALLLRIPKVIVVSATLRPKTMFMTGIGKDAFTFQEFDSDFDPKRCPIYWVPTMRVDKRAESLAMLWARLDQIASKRRDRKGIVHTISYARRDEIMSSSRFADSMIINQKGEAPTEMVDLYKTSPAGTMLVSPSVGTGYDFPDEDCRFQFVCKVPFEPPSKIQKARQSDDEEYVYYRAMQYLVQAFGRDMRSKRDWSERFICDDHIEWFRARYGHLAPKSFHAVFKHVDVLPQPLKLT